MEQLIEILKELHPDVDYENCTTLITDKILDSFDMITLSPRCITGLMLSFRQMN